MKSFHDILALFGTTGLIAIVLSLFFAIVSLLNAWRRHRQAYPPAPKAGPIHMIDPHTGAPVGLEIVPATAEPPPAAAAEPAPEPPPPPAPPAPVAVNRIFRQLDARGIDIDATRGGSHDEYQWE